MKRILHINTGTYIGGGIIKKIIHLIEHDRENEHVLFFIWYSDGQNRRFAMMRYLDTLGIKYHYAYHKSIWANIPDFYKYLKHNQYDLLHYYTDNVMVLGKIIQMMGIKTTVVRSLEGAPMYPKFPQKQLVNWALTSCNHYVSISHFVEQSYCQIYSSMRKGVFKSVVYNTPIGHLVKSNEVENRKGLICVGTLTGQKQFNVAIEIVKILKEKYNRCIPLYILGDGADREKLVRLSQKLGVRELVHFVGVIENPVEYYDRCRLFLHPAYSEGFGLVVAEAMSLELGVLVANSGALPELIEDKKNGYVLPLKEAEVWATKINEIYDDIKLLKFIGKAAHNTVNSDFSLAMHIKGYDDFYNKAISK